MSKDKRYVIPGDIITTAPHRLEQNVVLDGNRIIATTIGLADINDGSVRVIPLTGRYLPKGDDLVVGKVISHSAMSWDCLLYTSPSPRDGLLSRMPSSA